MATDRVTRPRVARRWSRWPVVAGVLFWVVVPVLCLVSVGIGIDQLVDRGRNVPPGVRGTFLVTSRTCEQGPCVSRGTFTSSDGLIVLPGQRGADGWLVGRQYGAVYGQHGKIVPLPGTPDPSPTIIGVAGAVGFLAVWGWLVRRRLAPGPSPRSAQAAQR